MHCHLKGCLRTPPIFTLICHADCDMAPPCGHVASTHNLLCCQDDLRWEQTHKLAVQEPSTTETPKWGVPAQEHDSGEEDAPPSAAPKSWQGVGDYQVQPALP